MAKRFHALVAVLTLAAAAGCTPAATQDVAQAQGAAASGQADTTSDPAQRKLLWGDLHMHTAWSFDAFTFKTTATPNDAYEFAQGASLPHPSGGVYKLDRPLDFLAVTDHSEFMGVMETMRDPNGPLSSLPVAQQAISQDFNIARQAFLAVSGAFRTGDLSVFGDKQEMVQHITRDTWAQTVDTANRQNKPGKFTALIGYEWTGSNDGRNLHRNVIFRGDTAPLPFSTVSSHRPEELWKWLDGVRQSGQQVLAIPHNSNLSDGLMFAKADSDGKPITAAYAAARARNEPLAEITQMKGTSEAHPTLSPNDEFADFELMETYVGRDRPVTKFDGGYVREALKAGLVFQDGQGFNPFHYGMVGASDSHNATTPTREDTYSGASGIRDGTPQLRLDCTFCAGGSDVRRVSSAGITGVWAAENTRAGVFDAMARSETYATTGPRIQVRFFGGYDLGGVRVGQGDWAKAAYAAGVPMGGTLAPKAVKAPSFAVWALKDAMGANLDRVQIVKVWSKNGVGHEKIYDVALSGNRKVDPGSGKAPAVGNTVNIREASYTNTIGAVSLTAKWTDPDFDASAPAAYYVRVLEIPTPRWSTFDAKALGRAVPADIPATIQERAFTSAIWYLPGG